MVTGSATDWGSAVASTRPRYTCAQPRPNAPQQSCWAQQSSTPLSAAASCVRALPVSQQRHRLVRGGPHQVGSREPHEQVQQAAKAGRRQVLHLRSTHQHASQAQALISRPPPSPSRAHPHPRSTLSRQLQLGVARVKQSSAAGADVLKSHCWLRARRAACTHLRGGEVLVDGLGAQRLRQHVPQRQRPGLALRHAHDRASDMQTASGPDLPRSATR